MPSDALNARREGHQKGQQLARVWAHVQTIYDGLTVEKKATTISPARIRRCFESPVLHLNPGDRVPDHYATIAINPMAPRAKIIAAVIGHLEESSDDQGAPRRTRYTASDIKRNVLWYYELIADPRKLNDLAIDEAARESRSRLTKRAQHGASAAAVNQAKARVNAGREWVDRLIGSFDLR